MMKQKFPRIIVAAFIGAGTMTMSGCSDGSTDPHNPSANANTATVSEGARGGADSADADQNGRHVPVDEFRKAIKDGAVIVDMRTAAEFNNGHIPGATLIDVTSPDFTQALQKLDKNKSYAIYCRSGNRSRTAAQAMVEAGFTKVIGLSGGIGAWDGDLG